MQTQVNEFVPQCIILDQSCERLSHLLRTIHHKDVLSMILNHLVSLLESFFTKHLRHIGSEGFLTTDDLLDSLSTEVRSSGLADVGIWILLRLYFNSVWFSLFQDRVLQVLRYRTYARLLYKFLHLLHIYLFLATFLNKLSRWVEQFRTLQAAGLIHVLLCFLFLSGRSIL